MINKLGPALSWRLVHDGSVVLMLEQVSGMTETMHQTFESNTLSACMAQIELLGLYIPPELEPQEQQEQQEPQEQSELVTVNAVSPRQIRQAMNRTLYGDGTLRDAVEAVVATGDRDLQDWWEFSTVFERNNQQVLVMARVLDLGDAALDELWMLAESL